MGANAAAGRQLGVEDVKGVGRDLRDVDVMQGPQVAGDDPPVLLERVGGPSSLLHRDPLLGQLAEGPPGMRHLEVTKFHLPGIRVALCAPLP